MADVAKLMEMMHPMREPPLPDSIAPALVLLIAGSVVAILLVGLGWRLAGPSEGLRASAIAALAFSRHLRPAERLAAQAALLRRLVRALGGDGAARQHGQAWLESLDRCFHTDFFSTGQGRAFGNDLYARSASPDVDAIDSTLMGLIRRLPAPTASRKGA